MGFWDWLKPKPQRVAWTDRVWLTATAKLAALAAEVNAAGGPVLVVAHFPKFQRETAEALAAVGLPGELLAGPLAAAGCLKRLAEGGPARPLLVLTSQLRPAEPSDQAGEPVRVLVAERHFLRSHDDEVVRFAEGFGRPVGVTFFLSLDDPLMKGFAGEWLADVLRRLGLKESEAVESPMVNRRVQAAQGKYARAARGDEPADSPEEWLARNVG